MSLALAEPWSGLRWPSPLLPTLEGDTILILNHLSHTVPDTLSSY